MMNHRNNSLDECDYKALHPVNCYDGGSDATSTSSTTSSTSSSSSSQRGPWFPSFPIQLCPCLVGAAFGFCIQLIAIYSGALALLLKDSNHHHHNNNNDTDVHGSPNFFIVTTTLLSRIDIVVYGVVWTTFTWIQFKADCPWRRRSVFITGISALVGLVTGSFISWVSMNRAMDYPISNIRFLITLLFDLILCYCMLVWNDWHDEKNEETVSPDDNEEAAALIV